MMVWLRERTLSNDETIDFQLERAAARAAERTLGLEGRHVLERVAGKLTGRAPSLCIGRYRLGAQLGRGGCGVVYAGFDPKLERDVAIKVVHPTGSDSADAEARLVREAQALAKVRHPNVVQIFDVGIDEIAADASSRRGIYIVMELVEGMSLADWLDECDRTSDEIFASFVQAARGLAAAHAAGVVHRDFKPSNAMIAGDRLQVLDFGLARDDLAIASATRPTEGDSAGGREISLTRTGAVMGTPRYMAPEQHEGREAGPAADQFAWCVALWHALSGEPPFGGRGLSELAAQKRGGPPGRPQCAAITARVHRVLAKGLQPDPARRHRDMEALLRALAAARGVRARRLVAVGIVAATLTATPLLIARGRAVPEACATERPDAWGDVEIERLASTLTGTPADSHWGSERRVARRLHRFVERWTQARATLCDPDAIELAFDERARRVDCLERGRARLDAILAGYARPSDGRAASTRRLWSSESPTACLTEAPDAIFARTDEEEAELDALDETLFGLVAPGGMRVEPDLDRMTLILERADALRDTALAVRTLIALSLLHGQQGRLAEAARTVQEAAWRAEASDDALLACEQLPTAIYTLQVSGAPNDEVDRLLEHADAMLQQAGAPLDLELDLARMQMLVIAQRGGHDRALAIGEAAIGRGLEAHLPGTERPLFDMLVLSAQIQWKQGLYAVARRSVDTALEVAPVEAPWREPNLRHAYAILAAISYQEGDEDAAIREMLTAIEHTTDLPPAHPDVLSHLAFYGLLLFERGQEVEGEAHLVRARDVLLLEHGFAIPKLGAVLSNLMLVQLARRDFVAALATADESLEFEIARHNQHGQARALIGRAAASLGLHRIEDAEHDAARGIELDEHGGRDGRLVMGEIHLLRQQWSEAEEQARWVLVAYHPAEAGRWADGGRAQALWILARAAHGRGDARGALELAELALHSYRRATVARRLRELPEVEAWVERVRGDHG